jgi:hypothetical protein
MRWEMESSLPIAGLGNHDNTSEKFPAAWRGRVPGCGHSVTEKQELCGCCQDYCDAMDAVADAAPAMQLPTVASTTTSLDDVAVKHAMTQEMQSGLPPAKALRAMRLVPTPVRGSRSSQAAAKQQAPTIVSARQPEAAEEIDEVSEHPRAETGAIEATPDHLTDFDDYPLDPMDDVPKFEGDMRMMTLGVQTPSLLRRFQRYDAFMNKPIEKNPNGRYGFMLTCGHGENEHVKACRVCHDHSDASAWLADLYARSRRAARSEGILELLVRRF